MSEMLFTERGWADYVYWEKQDRKTLSRINQLLQSIGREGAMDGAGHPERLKHEDEEAYSRRIDAKKVKSVIREYRTGRRFGRFGTPGKNAL